MKPLCHQNNEGSSGSEPENRAVSKPIHRFRQTRYQNELGQLGIVYRTNRFQVLNWSRTGVAFEISSEDKEFFEGKIVFPLQLFFNDIELLNCSVKVHHRTKISERFVHVGVSFVDSHLPVEAVESTRLLATIKKQTKEIFSLSSKLSPEFCQSIVTFLLLLDSVKKGCESEEERVSKLPLECRQESESFFLPNISSIALDVFSQVNQAIAKQVDVEELSDNSPFHEVFEKLIYPYFAESPVFARSHDKPRGYAGDYEMMNQVYRKGFEGPTLIARALHNYGTIEGCGEAVRLRKPYLIDHCKTILSNPGSKNILSVASGPAAECQELIRLTQGSDLERLTFTLLDSDIEALEHAQTKILRILSEQKKHADVHFVNDSVKSIILGRVKLPFDSYDLIYSAGLFDYLDERTAKVLVKNLFAMVSPGGLLAVGNFTKYNSSKAFLHLLCRWSLVHRSESDLMRLAEGVPTQNVSVRFDETNNIAFLVLTKER